MALAGDEIALRLKTEAETGRLAADLSIALPRSVVIALWGELGAGKSALARAFIRHRCDDRGLEVPSPTFTLSAMYECAEPIAHFDLYRLASADELEEIGIGEAMETGSVLIEWPELAEPLLTGECVHVRLDIVDQQERTATIRSSAANLAAISHALEVRRFVERHWAEDFERRPFAGDASTRRYERVTVAGESRLLMDMPAPDQQSGISEQVKSYRGTAQLADGVEAFLAIGELLAKRGFRVPEIFAAEPDAGLVLLEHLGEDGIIDPRGRPLPGRYVAAAALLGDLHASPWPRETRTDRGIVHKLPTYDAAAMMIEVGLLTEWYVSDLTGRPCTPSQQDRFTDIWRELISLVQQSPRTLVLRDFHSPNILWQAMADGRDRLGLIDFQDALLGPAAYDLASLGQDARVTVGVRLEAKIIETYVDKRRDADDGFDEAALRRDYAILAAQRATKILGGFVRLHLRDGKPEYRRHLRRMRTYLSRSLEHPVLDRYRQWCADVIKLQ